MLWLFDRDRAATAALAEYDSIVTTERFYEHSEWSGRFPADAFDALSAAYFAIVDTEPEVYLVEGVMIEATDDGEVCVASGRSATALLHTRTLNASWSWNATKTGAIVRALIDSLTGGRALPVSFGTGDTLGTAITVQRSHLDMGDVVRDLLAADSLGMRSRMSGTTVYIDVYEPTAVDALYGEKYGNGDSGRYERQIPEWRNFAIVLGEVPDPYVLHPSSSTITAGSSASGSSANITSTNGTFWQISESATTGLTVEFEFDTLMNAEPGEFVVRGYYTGTPPDGHHIEAQAYNYQTATWDEIADVMLPSGGTSPDTYSAPYTTDHHDTVNHKAKMRLKHHVTSYNNSHRVWLDEVSLTMTSGRVRVEVDETAGDERRELYVDARDLQRTVNGVRQSSAAYSAQLARRGAEKLADVRRVEYGEATVTAPVRAGEVLWYDSGRWSAELMVTEAQVTREGGTVRYDATLGEGPATLRKTIRKATT